MANVKATKKAIRVIKRKTEINKIRRTKVKTFFRKVHDAITAGSISDARKSFVEFESVLMKAVKNGIFKKNTASRKLTRLAGHIRKIKAAK
ncbi:MAG: 30S ribosomal protein S20 [Rickettsiales bacterium]|nr:MAG: 30S ribosomal protein S20 [Rickettsiales bacterium]